VRVPRIYPILDTATLERNGLTPIRAAEALLDAGAEMLQYRHKAHWTRQTFEEAEQIARLCGGVNARFIVNDRADYAALLHAGLHLGQEDLPPEDARRVVPEGTVIGFSTHNAAQMRAAQSEPIDYVAFGPVFPTASKENPDPVTGTLELSEVRSLTGLPLVAIGGITRENAQAVFDNGADSIALISALIPLSGSAAELRGNMREWLLAFPEIG
jgi:thiamine-phosphate pyrophosphorylase